MLLLLATQALAEAEEYFSDEQVAKRPVWVIGYSNTKRTVEPEHAGVEFWDRMVTTELVVTKVVKGDVKPGKYWLTYKVGLSYRLMGTMLNDEDRAFIAAEPSYVDLAVDGNVSKANLWMLEPRSIDGRQGFYLSSYRCIQNRRALPLYEALASSRPEQGVRNCLASRDPVLVERALNYVDGGLPPLPALNEATYWRIYGGDIPGPMQPHAELHKQYSKETLLIAERGPAACRGLATALYAQLEGSKADSFLESMLKDRSPGVVIAACCILARAHNDGNREEIAVACRRLSKRDLDPYAVGELLTDLSWNEDLSLVPAIIAFLESVQEEKGVFAMRVAEHAQGALTRLTGATFPLEFDRSLKAWEAVSALPVEQRAKRLTEILGDWGHAWKSSIRQAGLNLDGSARAEIVLTNQLPFSLAITEAPSSVQASAIGPQLPPAGWHTIPGDVPQGAVGNPRLTVVRPNESLHVFVSVSPTIFRGDSREWVGLLFYHKLFAKHTRTWRGSVTMYFGKSGQSNTP